MTVNVGCDMHKSYSLMSMIDEDAVINETVRVKHTNGELQDYLNDLPEGSTVAVEASEGWYRMVDAIEDAGLTPKLVNAHKAKVMMGNVDKTDKLDAQGLAHLLATGTLPEVWIPPKECRDKRELLRCRMYLVGKRTGLKNRVHSTLDKYGISGPRNRLFSVRGSSPLREIQAELPEEHGQTLAIQVQLIHRFTEAIDELTDRVRTVLKETSRMSLLKTAPGIGTILSAIICLEVGDVSRFPDGSHLASYAGTVPRVHSSGGQTRHGKTKKNVNTYLKWAFAEAANTVSAHRKAWSNLHVAQKYTELKKAKCHGKAIGAVSRHLAEATWHILTKGESYRDPNSNE